MMSKSIATGFLCAVLPLACIDAQGPGPRDLVHKQVTARVVGIIDGDTVDVVIRPSRRIRVRFHGADAPERNEPFYQQAVVFTRVFMFSRDVTLVGKDVDPYNRLVARIVVDGKDASESLIAAGLGCTFHRYISDPVLDAARSRAQSAHLGFWASGAGQPACIAREARTPAAITQQADTGVVGNVSSRLYHLPSCPNANCKNCTRKFASRADANGAGFKPAKDCIQP